MTGAITAFRDVGCTICALMVGVLRQSMSIRKVFLLTGAAFILLIPIALTLHD